MILKRLAWIAVAAVAAAAGARAQQSAGGTPPSGNLTPVTNPVSAAVKAQRPLAASADAHARHHERGGRAWRLIAPARHPVDEGAIHGN